MCGLALRFTKKLAEGVGNAPTSAMPILFSRQVQPAYICLPSQKGRVSSDGEGIQNPRVPAVFFHSTRDPRHLLSTMVRVAGIAPASSSFRGRPSAADI